LFFFFIFSLLLSSSRVQCDYCELASRVIRFIYDICDDRRLHGKTETDRDVERKIEKENE